MKNLMKKLFTYIPKYVVIPVICIFSLQSLIYFGTKLINNSMEHHTLITKIDKIAPILPSFAIIYVGCYIFWAFNYAIAGRMGKNYFYNFLANVVIGYLISGIIFCIYPTYITRPSLDNINGFGKLFMTYVYNTDTPVNLFPSMHCQISWYCFLAVYGHKEINKCYQVVSFIIAILVCISTVVIRQHYFVDIIAGVAIAEITFRLVMRTNLGILLSNIFEPINKKFKLD